MNTPHKTLSELGLSPSEIKVYLTMISGVTRVKDITKTTSLVRPTVYYAINGLENIGLVTRITIDEENHWKVSSPSKLSQIVNKKQKHISKLSHDVGGLIDSLKRESPESERPRVSYYQGIDAITGAAMDALYCKSKEILSIAPAQNFFHDADQGIINEFVRERAQRNLKTKHLWEEPLSSEIISAYYKQKDIRILPEVMHGQFDSVIFIYDDKTLYISSKKKSYAVLIKSQEHAQMMRAVFKGLWSTSTTFSK